MLERFSQINIIFNTQLTNIQKKTIRMLILNKLLLPEKKTYNSRKDLAKIIITLMVEAAERFICLSLKTKENLFNLMR